MAKLTIEFLIGQEQATLDFWLEKAMNAENLISALMSDSAEHRQEAIYARNCVGIQRLKIRQLEKERDE